MGKNSAHESGDGFHFSKKYGQNFLVNDTVPSKIADSLPDPSELCVLEIGPGGGALTVWLARRCKKVCAVEIDTTLRERLGEALEGIVNAEVVYGDILRTDVPALCLEKFGENARVAVCANLPYYITSPIIMRLLECGVKFESITVMVQKEVAQRICGGTGGSDCGAFTAVVSYYASAKKLFDVSRGNFYPVPKVDSTVIMLEPYAEPPVEGNREEIFAVIRAAFSQRRKTLKNALEATFGRTLPENGVSNALLSCGISPDVRGEKLSLEMFAAVARAISREKEKLKAKNDVLDT